MLKQKLVNYTLHYFKMTQQEEISRLIESEINHKKKKAPYKKPISVKLFEVQDFENRYKGRNIPEAVKVKNKYRDDTANGLTKLIVDFIKMQGGFATRITSSGTYRVDLQKFIPSTQRKGTPDISATYKGHSIWIEVKVGKDIMSEFQLKVKKEMERAGAVYIIARDFDGFLSDWELFITHCKLTP